MKNYLDLLKKVLDEESQWVVDNIYMVDRVILRYFPSLYGDILDEVRAVGMVQ